jgi:hypothetical protein
MTRYDAELDANGGYDHEYADDDNLLTEEELDLWRMEVQAEIDAENDARYDQYLAAVSPNGAPVIIAASRHVDLTEPPY